jgi:hypothetical protein
MPTGVLLGLAAGFREMFLTVKRISALTQWPGAAASSRESNGQKDEATAEATATTPHGTPAQRAEAQPRRTQLFVVPEPPLASFEKKERDVQSQAQQSLPGDTATHEDVPRSEPLGSDTLRELMGAERYAELQQELKAQNEKDSDEDTGNKSSDINRDQPQ